MTKNSDSNVLFSWVDEEIVYERSVSSLRAQNSVASGAAIGTCQNCSGAFLFLHKQFQSQALRLQLNEVLPLESVQVVCYVGISIVF